MARIAPVAGLMDTMAEAGSLFRYSVSRIAFFASLWKRGSMVVYTFNPPDRTVLAPYWRTSSS
jgi:hypothetical protein